jgi:hypothetical protein
MSGPIVGVFGCASERGRHERRQGGQGQEISRGWRVFISAGWPEDPPNVPAAREIPEPNLLTS